VYKAIKVCRVCKSPNLDPVLDLGVQNLTGVFPKKNEADPIASPLNIIYCHECKLVQLEHSVNPDFMYGDNYGYRSGLNESMKLHLKLKIDVLAQKFNITKNSIILDIGSNDGTSCNYWLKYSNFVTGMDPTASKFSEYYDPRVTVISNFFSSNNFLSRSKKADLITSIAMFYDLEDPVSFAKEISESLSNDGIWYLEQSYLVSMIRSTSYDTICHEHLEYYSLTSLNIIMTLAGLKIIDVSLNDTNGGSITITVAKIQSKYEVNTEYIDWLLAKETNFFCDSRKNLLMFNDKVKLHRDELKDLVLSLSLKSLIWGLGASTKGNTILQYCGFTSKEIAYIVDVNPRKWGCETPGSRIPIINEHALKDSKVNYILVLPWHFRKNLLGKAQDFFVSGGKYIFPLPEIEIVSG
jgi:hypothetical protein